MKPKILLTITSLVSILLSTFHLSEDVVRGIEPGGPKNVIGALLLVVWMYGALVLAGRRSGYIIMLLGAILGTGMPILHMTGAGLVGGRIEGSGGILFWVWTLMALEVVSIFALILAVRALWNPEWAERKLATDQRG